MKQFLLIALFSVFAFYGVAQSCQHSKNQHLKINQSDISSLADNLRSDTVDILKYTINLSITDFTTNIIRGNTVVLFTPKMNGVNKLKLDLLELTVDSIKQGNSLVPYLYNDTLVSVNLLSLMNIGDTSSVVVYYHGVPQGDASGWGGFYFQGGYAYNLGVGFSANPHVYGRVWFPCFDNFVERSAYEFNITTNAGKVAYCNGYLLNDTTNFSGDRTRTWIMNEQIPSYLASVSVANYTQVNKTYNGLNGTIPIVLTALPADTTNMKNSFINLNLALSTFENHFGPYMWNRVGYCLVPFSSGAMEHATNISYPKVAANGSLTYQTLYAHELSHHWFGDLATCRTAEDMWLNEGWARYCEFLFTEAYSGTNAYMSAVRTNHEDNLHFNKVKEGNLTLSAIPHAFTYGDHVYNKGADVAHSLRGYMGDSLFFYSVKTYLSQNNYKDVSSTDFMNALTAASGMDMSYFFNDWVFNPGWCHFSVDSFKVVPSGVNYDVTVYIKQKLTDAPNYYQQVPLNITFKAQNFTENKQQIVMNGSYGVYTLTVPFNPSFVAVNMDEKISHAVAPDYKVIKTTGTHNFSNAKMSLNVLSVSDSTFVRVEHNYTAPDTFKILGMGYRLSPNHYWKVDGIKNGLFNAKATISYDGRTTSFSGNMWLDNLLINAAEDSLVLLFRKSAADDWTLYPYYTRNFLGSNTDKRGSITIDSLQFGEYVFAMRDHALEINEIQNNENSLIIYPNPAGQQVNLYMPFLDVTKSTRLICSVCDITGKEVIRAEYKANNVLTIDTSDLLDGIYFLKVTTPNNMTFGKFVVVH